MLIGLNLISFSVFWQKQKEYNQLEQISARKIIFVNFLDLFINKVLDPSFTIDLLRNNSSFASISAKIEVYDEI